VFVKQIYKQRIIFTNSTSSEFDLDEGEKYSKTNFYNNHNDFRPIFRIPYFLILYYFAEINNLTKFIITYVFQKKITVAYGDGNSGQKSWST